MHNGISEHRSDRSLGRKALVKGVVFLLSLVVFGLVIRWVHFEDIVDAGWMESLVKGKGSYGVLLFLGIAALFTGAGLPRQIISFVGGYIYGVLTGTLLALTGTVLGCLLAFYYARILGRDLLRSRYSKKIEKIDAFLRQNPFSMALLIRTIPVGSNVLTNLLAGVSSVRSGFFVLGSAVGYLPQTLIFALLGSGFKVEPFWRIGLSVALFFLSIWWGILIFRKFRMETILNGEKNGAVE